VYFIYCEAASPPHCFASAERQLAALLILVLLSG
jgi:hypothetical protein